MEKSKHIIRVALCVAMLIGGQMALSAIPGIEVVTILFLSFSVTYGVKDALAAGTVFSVLRCLIFGFYINVILLYLIYYNLFGLFFGLLGKRILNAKPFWRLFTVSLLVLLFTALFTLLDNILSAVLFGFGKEAFFAYSLASLYTVIPQMLCAVATTAMFFLPLTKVMRRFA
ncbi:MAG: hypothetical protein J6K61_02715 [Clostridia bacterium]|nr:hypothetical protein [Clostridia bacterium]